MEDIQVHPVDSCKGCCSISSTGHRQPCHPRAGDPCFDGRHFLLTLPNSWGSWVDGSFTVITPAHILIDLITSLIDPGLSGGVYAFLYLMVDLPVSSSCFWSCWSSQSSNLVEGHYSKSRFKVQLRFSRSSTSRIVYAHSSERHLGEAMWPCNANHKITSRHDAIGEFQTPFCKQDLICLEFQMAWHNFSNHGQSRWGSMPTT